MDAVKFLSEWRRMCITSGNNCPNCAAPCPVCMDEMGDGRIVNTVETVEKWSAEHPQKTRLDDLKEKFPNFIMKENGYPVPLPFAFGYCGRTKCAGCDHFQKQIEDMSSKPCWDLPVDEVTP